LKNIADDAEQKSECRLEARGLYSNFNKLETGILALFWNDVLQQFQKCSSTLQSADQDLNTSCALWESLTAFIFTLRTGYNEIEEKAKKFTNCSEYKQDSQRARTVNRKYDAPESAPDEVQTASAKFQTGTFLVIIDNLIAALTRRQQAYAKLNSRFAFFRKLTTLSSEEISAASVHLVNSYPDDLEHSINNELIQFSSLLKTELWQQTISTGKTADREDSGEVITYNTKQILIYQCLNDY
jgi:hypothetical protein